MEISQKLPARLPNDGQASQPAAEESYNKNFQTYIRLLTESLKHQDPENPLSGQELAKQMIEISAVDLQVKQNEELRQIRELMAAREASAAIAYIGNEVKTTGATAFHGGTGSTWQLSSPADTPNAQLNVRSQTGDIVFSKAVPLQQGPNTYAWSGTSYDGSVVPPGKYTLEVLAKDAAGKTLSVDLSYRGQVDAVSFERGEALLHVGDTTLPLTSVNWVGRTTT